MLHWERERERVEFQLKNKKNEFDLQIKLLCYSALNRTTKLANYLSIKQLKERQILSKYRLGDHDLEIEKSWIPREQRLCRHWPESNRGWETLSSCLPQIHHYKAIFFPQFEVLNCLFFLWMTQWNTLYTRRELHCSKLAAKYAYAPYKMVNSLYPFALFDILHCI